MCSLRLNKLNRRRINKRDSLGSVLVKQELNLGHLNGSTSSSQTFRCPSWEKISRKHNWIKVESFFVHRRVFLWPMNGLILELKLLRSKKELEENMNHFFCSYKDQSTVRLGDRFASLVLWRSGFESLESFKLVAVLKRNTQIHVLQHQ